MAKRKTDIKKVRVRFAPSPTGYLHIGNARTALFNWLFARQQKGQFIIRVEDTDRQRSTEEFERAILEDLKWLGLDWDEGPNKGGPFDPYRQSERFVSYREYADRLIDEGKAYPCYCSRERLEELKRKQAKAGWAPKYDGRCRMLPKADRPPEIKPVIRFTVSERLVVFEDKVHKAVSFDASTFGDFIIIGSDGIATYNFAVVIDDALMKITHVIRGEDHLSNTPRQILIGEAFSFSIPEYVHMPLIFGPDRSPLGKRHGVASVRDLRESGFLPEAILNHLCHLGLSPGKDILSRDEAVESFSLERLSKSPAVFDIERLKRMNRVYMVKADRSRLAGLVEPYLKGDIPMDWLKHAVGAAVGEATTLSGIAEVLSQLLNQPVFDGEGERVLREPYVKELFEILAGEVTKEESLTAGTYAEIMKDVKQKTGESGRRLFMPVRVALTGSLKGIELDKIFVLLGKEEVVRRIKKVLVLT